MNILKKADEIINKRGEEKARQYGPMSLTNKKAADIASLLLNKKVTTLDIYYFQIALKLARESWSHKEDNLLDAVAYIGGLNNYLEGIKKEPLDIVHDEDK